MPILYWRIVFWRACLAKRVGTYPFNREGIVDWLKVHRHQAFVVTCVSMAHIAALVSLARILEFSTINTPPQPLNVAFIRGYDTENQEPAIDGLLDPLVIVAPEIVIKLEDRRDAMAAEMQSSKTGPRMDPRHLNNFPVYEEVTANLVKSSFLLLRLFVDETGHIGSVEIVVSSGNDEVDAMTVNYVMANWRYLPATINGRAVEDWMTARIPVLRT